jgi:hypothetical protein
MESTAKLVEISSINPCNPEADYHQQYADRHIADLTIGRHETV